MADGTQRAALLADITYAPDVAGSALIVFWRRVPIGFINQLKRVPRLPRHLVGTGRDKVRASYRSHIGQWYSAMMYSGYFDTKEDAALSLVERALKNADQSTSPLIRAAIRNDSNEVDRLLAQAKEIARKACE